MLDFLFFLQNDKRPTELQNMERIKRDQIVRKIEEVDGVTIRQIARLTG